MLSLFFLLLIGCNTGKGVSEGGRIMSEGGAVVGQGGVKVVEELMKLNKDSTMPTQTTQIDVAASADDLKSMLNDPRYYDSSKRDPAYVKRVTELYEKAYKNQAK